LHISCAGTITFKIPADSIPATEDKRAISEAVLAAAEIEMTKEER
jgi:hypothetical protein